MPSEEYERLSKALGEVRDHVSGKKPLEVRVPKRPKSSTVTLERDDEPLAELPPLRADEVQAIRERTGLSQAEFARLFSVSLAGLKKWEQGQRQARGPSAALLRIIDANPEAAVRALRARATPKRVRARRVKQSPARKAPAKKAPARKRTRAAGGS